jgi:hypothetical protein
MSAAEDFKAIKLEIDKYLEIKSHSEILNLMETLKKWKATTEGLKTSKIGVYITGE